MTVSGSSNVALCFRSSYEPSLRSLMSRDDRSSLVISKPPQPSNPPTKAVRSNDHRGESSPFRQPSNPISHGPLQNGFMMSQTISAAPIPIPTQRNFSIDYPSIDTDVEANTFPQISSSPPSHKATACSPSFLYGKPTLSPPAQSGAAPRESLAARSLNATFQRANAGTGITPKLFPNVGSTLKAWYRKML